MIDLHSHILPGMDDGSKDAEMSRSMLAMMREQGIEAVVATPHFYARQEDPQKFLQCREAAFAQLEGLTEESPKILLGAEVAYFDSMSRSEDLIKLQLADSGLLLVEMPMGSWTARMVQELYQLQAQLGLTPVLAHIDRYRRADQLPKYRKQLQAQGVLFQCNAGPFLRLMDRRWALGQLRQGNIHFLGSDTHNLTDRAPNLGKAAEVISHKFGQGLLDDITDLSKELLKL